MSRRNSREEKAKRRAHRDLTKGTGATQLDLIHYIKQRTNCTTDSAIKVLLSGAVRVDSDPVGFRRLPNGKRVIQRYIDAKHRDRIIVVVPEEEELVAGRIDAHLLKGTRV